MEKVIFVNQEGKNVFILKDLKDLILPREGELVVWGRMSMLVELIEHDFDTKTITINVEV